MDYNTINNRRVAEEFKGFASEERHDFIKKVYSILILMLLFTAGTTAIFLEVESVRDFVRDHYIPIMIPAIVFLFVLLFMMICIPTCRYRSPHNYICLFSFTALMSLLVGVVTSYYKTNIVFLAFSATAFIAVSLTAFTFQTKYDFTGWGPYLLCFLIGLIFMGIIQIFVRDQILETVVASFGAILFSFYIIYDTQLMLGGDHKNSIGPDEYIFAALSLYLDIINLFLYLLRIFDSCDN